MDASFPLASLPLPMVVLVSTTPGSPRMLRAMRSAASSVLSRLECTALRHTGELCVRAEAHHRLPEDAVAGPEAAGGLADSFDLSRQHHAQDRPPRSRKAHGQRHGDPIDGGNAEAADVAVADGHGCGEDPNEDFIVLGHWCRHVREPKDIGRPVLRTHDGLHGATVTTTLSFL
jgi:hypothetical protein